MGFLADKTVFSPLTKEILEESISFSCGNEDLDGFFHNDAVAYADNLFGKSYCYNLEESKAVILALFADNIWWKHSGQEGIFLAKAYMFVSMTACTIAFFS